MTVFSILSLTTTPSRTLRRPRTSGAAVTSLIDILLGVDGFRDLLRGLRGLGDRNCGRNDRGNFEAGGRFRTRRAGGFRLCRDGAGGSNLEERRTQAALDLDLHGHRPGDLMPDLAHLAVVLHLPGGLLEAHLEEAPALLAQVVVELHNGHA